jgi:pilus assembly protein CpaE
VVVDIEAMHDARRALEDLARVCPPDVKVLVVGDNAEIGFYRMLINELGVTEYVHKPLTRDMVLRLLLPHLRGDAPDAASARSGHVVAVCGARGGVGATTIAANAAVALAEISKGQVALLDLHLQGGAAAAMLASRPGAGLRIALEEPERADQLLLERSAIQIDNRLRLIAAEETYGPMPEVSEAGVAKVLNLVRQKFNYIVVDLPMPLMPATSVVMSAAREIVIVLGPDVIGLRDARSIRLMATARAGLDRSVTVLNRSDIKGGLPPALIEKGLGAAPNIVIPDLGRRMIDAVNEGVPALRRVPALRKHLLPLISEIAGIRTASRRSSPLTRIFGR